MPTIADEVFRDHERYTGDGFPNEPVGKPLPQGDPASGVHNPRKSDMRAAFNGVMTAAAASAAAAALYAPGYFPDLAALKADDTLWPNGQVLNTRSEGYVYEAVAVGSTDYHLVNAGGKKLRVSDKNRSVTPAMFGAVGDGIADDLAAVQAAWDFSGANNVPCFMEGLEYNCSEALYTCSNLTVLGGGAVLYITAWPSAGGFVSNVTPLAADRVQTNIRIYDLVTDGHKLPAPAAGQNTNLGPEFAHGASNVRVVNCIARKIRDGSGGGTGGAGHGGEQGLHDVQFIGCVNEDVYRAFRVAGLPGTHPSGQSREATGIVFRDCVARRCGTILFDHSVGETTGDAESDLGVFDVVVDGMYVEDCGHYPWREFDFAANPLISPQKCGVINLGGAQNLKMRGVRVKFNPGFPQTFTDWLGRTGYPASGNYIGAGLSGNVGALVWGHGRNCEIDITLDGAVDTYWQCARAITFGDLGTTAPTSAGGVVQQNYMSIRHVRQTAYNYVFDGVTGLNNANFGAQMDVFVGANPVMGVIGPNGTATLSNLLVKFTTGSGATEEGDAVQWLAAGNARPTGAEVAFGHGGADFMGGYSNTGTKNGITVNPTNGDIRSSRSVSTLAYHQRYYNPNGVVGGVATRDGRTLFYITDTVWISGGPGSPEGVVTGPVGCQWMRTDGGAGTTLYVKQTGTGNTGWVAK